MSMFQNFYLLAKVLGSLAREFLILQANKVTFQGGGHFVKVKGCRRQRRSKRDQGQVRGTGRKVEVVCAGLFCSKVHFLEV